MDAGLLEQRIDHRLGSWLRWAQALTVEAQHLLMGGLALRLPPALSAPGQILNPPGGGAAGNEKNTFYAVNVSLYIYNNTNIVKMY